MKYIFCITVALSLCIAQDSGWTIYNTANDQLPSNSVQTIVVDNNGNKWIGTSSGLTKFDGTNWTTYTTSNSGIPHNDVEVIAIDSVGSIWVGTSNYGLARLDGVNSWTVYNTENSDLPDDHIYSIAVDSEGNKWIATSWGLTKFDDFTWTVYDIYNSYIPDNDIDIVAIDSNDNKWILFGYNKLARSYGDYWIVYNSGNSDLPSGTIYSIKIDALDNIWIGQSSKLTKFDGESWEVMVSSSSTLSGIVYSIAIVQQVNEPEGGFAATITGSGGENSYDMTFGFHPDATDGYDPGYDILAPPAPPPPVFDAALGWGGDRYYTQILAWDGDYSEHEYDIALAYGSDNLITLTWDNTGFSGLMSSCILQDAFGGAFINIDMVTSEGTVNPAFASWDGSVLSLFSTAVNTLKLKVTPLPNARKTSGISGDNDSEDIVTVSHTAGWNRDNSNILWIGTSSGLFRYDWSYANFYKTSNSYLPSTNVYSIVIDGEDNKWAGTYGGGIAVIDSDAKNITVTYPNGGEQLFAQETYNLSWYSNQVDFVKIDLTVDGSHWVTLTESTPAEVESYSFTIPNTVSGSSCLIEISDVNDENINDKNDFGFSIIQPITVTDPNGGENWNIGRTYDITWDNYTGNNVNIEYSIDTGTNWIPIAENVSVSLNSYTWLVPDTPSGHCLIKVSDVNNPDINDFSNTFFTISTPLITIISPNGGEVWEGTSTQSILWTSENLSRLKIDFSSDGGQNWSNITTYATNGSHTWTVPNINSEECKIKISDYYNSDMFVESDSYFTITPIPVTLYIPDGDENWNVGEVHDITWSTYNIENVRLEYSVDGGTNWGTIIESTSANAGVYSWTVPDTPSVLCLLKVSDVSDLNVYDISDDPFTISIGSVVVLSPNGGESWEGGTEQTIQWTSENLTRVNIDFSSDDGQSWSEIVTNTTSDGSYDWTVENVNSQECKIRIANYYNTNVMDESDETFTIESTQTLNLYSPAPNSSVYIGVNINSISWTSENVEFIKIELSIDNGSTWSTLFESVTTLTSYLWWAPPNTPSDECKIKISDTSNPSLFDITDGTFSISLASINLITPNGGEILQSNSTCEIAWVSLDYYYPWIYVYFSHDGGNNWIPVSDGMFDYITNNFTYTWTVPNIASDFCKIRVQFLYADFYDESEDYFTIVGAPDLTLTTPNGGEEWYADWEYAIEWSSIEIDNIKIEYSIDNGTSWSTITESTSANEGTFIWSVPEQLSENGLIKITDVENSDVYDISDSTFTILNSDIYRPSITSIVDIPNDQGGWVYLTFTKSAFDTDSLNRSTESYQIERYDEDNWVGIANYSAYGQDFYTVEVRTVQDSVSEGSNGLTSFRVIAAMDEGNWVSDVAYGYSTDDIPPSVPTGLFLSLLADETIQLIWDESIDDDFSYFRVYRGVNSGEMMEMAETMENLFVDTNVNPSEMYVYSITAVDTHNNESEFSDMVSSTLSLQDQIGIPIAYAIHSNHPNPFNPITSLRYDLPEQAQVTLTVYDLMGREVTQLINTTQEAGYKSIQWNATDIHGKPVSAGVFLYQIRAGGFVQTRKMVLLK